MIICPDCGAKGTLELMPYGEENLPCCRECGFVAEQTVPLPHMVEIDIELEEMAKLRERYYPDVGNE